MRSEHLPGAPDPQGAYVPVVCGTYLLLTAGMTPRVDGVLQHRGRVGAEISVREAQEAAAIALTNTVSAAASAVGGLANVGRPLRLTVYVNAVPGFEEHSAVADGASRRLAELLGEHASTVRSAVGVGSLPGGACVEIELTCER